MQCLASPLALRRISRSPLRGFMQGFAPVSPVCRKLAIGSSSAACLLVDPVMIGSATSPAWAMLRPRVREKTAASAARQDIGNAPEVITHEKWPPGFRQAVQPICFVAFARHRAFEMRDESVAFALEVCRQHQSYFTSGRPCPPSAIKASIRASSTGSGTEPSDNTTSWNLRMSKSSPSSCSALARTRRMVISPSL